MKRFRPPITPVRQYGARWGFDDYFTTGERVQVRRDTKSKAVRAYSDLSVLIANGRKDLADINPIELSEFRTWKSQNQCSRLLHELIDEFIASKQSERDVGRKWIIKLRQYLALFESKFGGEQIGNVMAPAISKWLGQSLTSPRSRNNVRSAIVQLFRWSRANQYLPDSTTEAERVRKLKVRRSETIFLWTPEEMRSRLDACPGDLIAYQALGAFAGVRAEELAPEYADKSPLDWSDFDWDEKIIHIRSETSKVGEARHVPILPILEYWLRPLIQNSGPCCKHGRNAGSRMNQILARLSNIPHKRNANRHSFITYWMAIHKDIGRCAEECGTSIYKIKTNYRRPANLSVANAFFNLYPRDDDKVIEIDRISNRSIKGSPQIRTEKRASPIPNR